MNLKSVIIQESEGCQMTDKRRAEIFSKETISTKELAELYGVCLSSASQLMQRIKRSGDRLNIRGKIHVKDYLTFIGE